MAKKLRQVEKIQAERTEIGRRIKTLTKKARAKTITPLENDELLLLQHKHRDLGRRLAKILTKPRILDPLELARSRAKGSRTRQGPAGGVRHIVGGGAPGLGKRS
ncbi:hypothetical protein [Kribbella sancticallisti]|uniref:hypothetical protein n=1 Tax=Kribbella sancticallisti TaxID=460087 RepID=UPI0031D18F94